MDADLEEIIQEIEGMDAESFPPDEHVSSCWGGRLAGTISRCQPVDAGFSNHFKHKLCAACQSNTILVPVERVRAIHPSQHAVFTNTPTSGVWTEMNVDGSLVYFRLVNQTRKCSGDWLVIFRSSPADFLPWAPLPAESLHAGFVRLKLAKGTLIPDRNSSAARSHAAQAIAWPVCSTKRARVEHEAVQVLAASEPRPSSSTSPLPAATRSRSRSRSRRRRIAAHS